MKRTIEKIRTEYENTPFDEIDLKDNPIELFCVWLDQAIEANVMEPNGMVLSTVTREGRPTSRTVLLKQVNEKGFIFYTHYISRKGEQLLEHPFAALTFWWKEIYRQVNIEGTVKRTTRAQSKAYFAKRPRGAQLAALASKQSHPLATRLEIEETYNRLKKELRGKPIPCPKTWGGFCVVPNRMEFWQGRPNRLHDRFLYVQANNEWIKTRLAP